LPENMILGKTLLARLQSLSGPRRERLWRRRVGAIIRPKAAVRALRASLTS
jgi:hypothetical protein